MGCRPSAKHETPIQDSSRFLRKNQSRLGFDLYFQQNTNKNDTTNNKKTKTEPKTLHPSEHQKLPWFPRKKGLTGLTHGKFTKSGIRKKKNYKNPCHLPVFRCCPSIHVTFHCPVFGCSVFPPTLAFSASRFTKATSILKQKMPWDLTHRDPKRSGVAEV